MNRIFRNVAETQPQNLRPVVDGFESRPKLVEHAGRDDFINALVDDRDLVAAKEIAVTNGIPLIYVRSCAMHAQKQLRSLEGDSEALKFASTICREYSEY
tara:strand:- start:1841 stop:2140 length:300 start_codon:yes stop_codon:yes gene_type:complete